VPRSQKSNRCQGKTGNAMSNKRKLRELNRTSGLLQRPRKLWGRTAPLLAAGRFTKADIRRWLRWSQRKAEKEEARR